MRFVAVAAFALHWELCLAKPVKPSPTGAAERFGPSAYTAGPYGPTDGDFYAGFEPTQTSVEPQPRVTDPVRNKFVYPLNLTDAKTIPTNNTQDPSYLPPSMSHPNTNAQIFYASQSDNGKTNFSTPASLSSLSYAISNISAIISGNGPANASGTCANCVAALKIAQTLVQEWPWEGPSLVISLCEKFAPGSAYGSCAENYGVSSTGSQITQVLYFANMDSLDAIMICAKQLPKAYCAVPPVSEYNASDYYNTTFPAPGAIAVKKSSGKRLKVLHLSDFHLDPSYDVGSISNCDGYLCCQSFSLLPNGTSAVPSPAPRYGAFKCDTPYDLAMSAMEAIPVLTGTQKHGFDFSIFTGDLVVHLNDNQLSRDFVEYTETIVYGFFKRFLGAGAVYAALGNHDSWPQALNSLNSLKPSYLADQFNWNYDHVSSLWSSYKWIKQPEVELARTHYGGYSIKTKQGLRVITYNSDNMYTANLYNYINMTDPDNSGTFKWIAGELQRAEDLGERVWLVSHIPAGFDGSSALKNPSDLLQQIVARYSPGTIAAAFQGHIHDEAVNLNYANNGTVKSAETAINVNWIGPSLTPLTNLNSGFRMYEVDSNSFDVMDSYTWYSNVSEFASLDHQNHQGASYHFEYSAREAYGGNVSWPTTAPLNATWWHKVTEQMEINPSLITDFQNHQGRLSVLTPNCTSTICQQAKVCYIRAGTNAQGQACPKGFSSVQ